jgi:SAM-dependent methyltransferase
MIIMNTKPLLAEETLEKLLTAYRFDSVLDVGCGTGRHSRLFQQAGKQVTSIDIYPGLEDAVQADYLRHEFAAPFDCVWVSHVLEHQLNVNQFLTKIFRDLKEGGILALTIPPLKHEIVGGHVTLWNAGLLLYNLILAGFDCSQAAIKCYGYNISVITAKTSARIPWDQLKYDTGDIETLAPFFPIVEGMQWSQSFNGRIKQINWDRPGIEFHAERGFKPWLRRLLGRDRARLQQHRSQAA